MLLRKILLGHILNQNIYTGSYINSKKNYDRMAILINNFLLKYKTNLDKINRIYKQRTVVILVKKLLINR